MLMEYIKSNIKKISFIIAIILILTISISYIYVKDVYGNLESYKDNIIRFHVIANSDSAYDQSLKLKVRDRVLEDVGKRFENINSIDVSREVLRGSLEDIKNIAKNELLANGVDYNVNVYLENHEFPTKSYGNFTLPAGEYEAVRVVIGEGIGQNWWCVMFPPLCYVDVAHGLTDAKTEEELRRILNEDEYDMITSAKHEKNSVVLKFKIVEMFQNSKIGKLFVSSK